MRAAASSMASGKPSRRRQISAIAPALPAVSSKPAVVAAGALHEQRAGGGMPTAVGSASAGLQWRDAVAVLGL